MITIFLMALMGLNLKAQNIKPDVVISTTATSINEVYNPCVKRNPMIASTIKGSSTLKYDMKFSSVTISNDDFYLKSFVLTGIIKLFDKKEAILKNLLNNEMYILRNNKLYDIKKVPLNGIKGEIRGKSVYLYDIEKKQGVELYLNNEKE
jgi:hypothetical protein